MEIATSVLSIKQEQNYPIKQFYAIETAKTDYFHIDVMDGKFVEQDTTEKMAEYAQTIKQISNIPLDIHLMVEEVEKYVEEYIPLEPAYITMHYESFKDDQSRIEMIQKVREAGIKVGMAIKPDTKVEVLKPLLPMLHLVLVMTVEPGYGGQPFMYEMVAKIEQLSKEIETNNCDYFIEADGGINLETVEAVKEAGCDIAVVGTAIIQAENKKDIIAQLKK